ncbi:MAG TPA: GAF domain-containing protein [Anaerolineales bacterium]|nr:GAF domain-containing protein [Anaerolineales bacterium]
MNKRFFKLPEDATPEAQNAFRYAIALTLVTLAVLPMEVYFAIKLGGWQLWAGSLVILGVFAASLISQRLLRLGKTEAAGIILIYSILLGIVVNPLFLADVGTGLGVAAIMLTINIASRTTKRPEIHVIVGFVMGAVTILLDVLLPSYRLSVPALKIFVPIASGAFVLILTYMTLRGFRDYTLRVKMIITIVAIVMISVGTIAFMTNTSLTSYLTSSAGNTLSTTAASAARSIAQTVDREFSLLQMLSTNETIQLTALNSSLYNDPLSQAEIETLDKQWKSGNEDSDNPLVMSVLYNYNASLLRQFRDTYPEHVELILTDKQGVNLSTTNRTSDYYQADEEWWQVAFKEGMYIGQPEHDESTKTTALVMAIAIREETTGNVTAILRTTFAVDTVMHPLLSVGSLGTTGQTVVYLPNGNELALLPGSNGTPTIVMQKSGFGPDILTGAKKDTYFEADYNGITMLASQSKVAELPENTSDVATTEKAQAMTNLNMRVVAFQEQAEILQSISAQTLNLVLLALGIFIAATLIALGLAQIISGPIVRLNTVAEKVAAGDLSVQAIVETGDETGTLAQTFNTMTAQLRDLVGTLEQRVADRTKALAASSEVSRRLSTILNERQLIIEVVEQIKEAFDYYHVHIYLADEFSGDLVMAGGTGDVGASLLGSGHRVSKGKGLVGRSALNNLPILVSNTAKDPDWLPNPLLPETKSEVAIPIATANKVLGVLDVQQNETNGLTQDDVDLLQSLANQIAIALQNARSYVEVQQRADREARITSIGLKIKSTTSLEGALQTAARELGKNLGMNDIRVILEAPGTSKSGSKPD